VAIVGARDAGVTIGPRLKTLGYQGLAVSALTLDNVRVPANRFLGPLPDGKLIDALLLTEALMLTQASVGLAQQVYKTAVAHAKRHRRGGRAIIKYQEVGFKLAEILTQVQTAQLLGYRAGWLARAARRSGHGHALRQNLRQERRAGAANALQIWPRRYCGAPRRARLPRASTPPSRRLEQRKGAHDRRDYI
jgi:alkylation response protein AidB-like acyl-CoA dehydrogenase